MPAKRSVLVLGAGIQGLCVALALRSRGFHVTVVEQAPDLMQRTSLRNEGKIHLGFVYANDSSFQTSALLLRAALKFAPLLDHWLEQPVDWRTLVSHPFTYLVARDSMLDPNAIRAHYLKLQQQLDDMVLAGECANYLGQDLSSERIWCPSSPALSGWYATTHVADCIETAEVALNRSALADILRARLAAFPEIELRYGHRVETIERTTAGYHVAGERSDGTRWCETSNIVVNCLWAGRFLLDRQLGLAPRHPLVMRLKYRVLGELVPSLQAMPSLTMVLGRYGDIVVSPGAPTYLSWYPACLRGWSRTFAPPPEWQQVCAGNPPHEIAADVARETLDAFEQIVPGTRSTRVSTVDGGIICAWGETDIDDSASMLHKRFEIGFTHSSNYYSVDTGKFTCAPLFADRLVEHLDS